MIINNNHKVVINKKHLSSLLDNMDDILKQFNDIARLINYEWLVDAYRLRYIRFLFRLIYDKNENMFYIVSPYSKEMWKTSLENQIKAIEKILLYVFRKHIIEIFDYPKDDKSIETLDYQINSYFNLDLLMSGRFKKDLQFYDDYEHQLQLFMNLADERDLKNLEYIKELENILNDNEDDITNGYALTFKTDYLDANINKKRENYNSFKLKITHFNKDNHVCCHILPHRYLKHSQVTYSNLYIGGTRILNDYMKRFENFIDLQILAKFWFFKLKVIVRVNEFKNLEVHYICKPLTKYKGLAIFTNSLITNEESYFYFDKPKYSQKWIKKNDLGVQIND